MPVSHRASPLLADGDDARGGAARDPRFLGSDRLARPIAEHAPDLVVHGHGHAGTFEGYIGSIPVFNVSLPVLGHDFWVFELDGSKGGLKHGPL